MHVIYVYDGKKQFTRHWLHLCNTKPYKKYYGYKYSIYTTIQKFRVSGIFKKKFILLFSKDGINW